jgi:hypothetical protein
MFNSALKRIIPRSMRIFLRDRDVVYQNLQNSYQERLKEIESKNHQIVDLENSYQERLKEIESKNHQIVDLENSYQERLKEIESKNHHWQEFRLSDKDYEKLDKAGLFIVGSARSGTSILCDCLNLSPEIFLLGEANLYINHDLENFVVFFNNQHIQFKNRKSKGTFVPLARESEKGAFNFLQRMKKNFRFVGEKIAFGPQGKINNLSIQEVFFDFHSRYFYFSNYILILRRPTEVVLSMSKMFPEVSINSLFDCWLRTIQVQIDVFQSFPNAYVIFFQDLSNEAIINLCSLIGLNIHIPTGMLREENKHSLVADNQMPDELSNHSQICLDCERIYKQLKDAFSIESFKFKPTTANYGNANYGFSSYIQKQIDELISSLQE